MRSEDAMLYLITEAAERDARVRAAILGGSRTESSAPRDIFQDYDVVFLVSEMDSLVGDESWLEPFGERIIMQKPDEIDRATRGVTGRDGFAYLMLFSDGNRIDLTLHPVARLASLQIDHPYRVLLDKDGIAGAIGRDQYLDHRMRPPTQAEYDACCNEFWWVSTYVAKGIWRRELPYASAMLEGPVRGMLLRMLSWYVLLQSGGTAQPGKAGRHLQKFLPKAIWERYRQTVPDAEYARIWAALFAMGDLFREIATAVGEAQDYRYPREDDRRVTAHLRRVERLPSDATTF